MAFLRIKTEGFIFVVILMTKTMQQIIEEIENEGIEKSATEQMEAIEKSVDNIFKILENKDLLEIIDSEFDKFVVGENEARKTIFLISCGRLVQNAQESSYNLLVNSGSGAGKDFVVNSTLRIWPDDIIQSRKKISPTVFTYWHNAKFEPEWSWNGKIFYGEDIPSNVLNSDVFKIMASSGHGKSTVTINNKAIDIEVVGKPVMIITSATANPKSELLRRFTNLELDESVNQTKEIMKRQAIKASTGDIPVYTSDLKEALGELKRVKVRVPFAEHLVNLLPSDNIIMRTCFQRFIDYIKASAALHQYQRQQDMDDYLRAEIQDYELARMAILKTTSNQHMIPLTRTQKQILDIFKELGDYWFSIPQIEVKASFTSERTLYNQLPNLVQHGFLNMKIEITEDSKKPVKMYKHKEFSLLSLPTASELEDLIANVSNVAINLSIETNESIASKVFEQIPYTEENPDSNGISIVDLQKKFPLYAKFIPEMVNKWKPETVFEVFRGKVKRICKTLPSHLKEVNIDGIEVKN